MVLSIFQTHMNIKQIFQNFESWTKRHEFSICFCNKISYYIQEFFEGLNEHGCYFKFL